MAKKRGDLGKKSKSHSKKKKSSHKVQEIHLRRAHSGELLAKHKHAMGADGISPEDAEHVVPEGGLDDHVQEHMPAEPEPAPVAPGPQSGAMPGAM